MHSTRILRISLNKKGRSISLLIMANCSILSNTSRVIQALDLLSRVPVLCFGYYFASHAIANSGLDEIRRRLAECLDRSLDRSNVQRAHPGGRCISHDGIQRQLVPEDLLAFFPLPCSPGFPSSLLRDETTSASHRIVADRRYLHRSYAHTQLILSLRSSFDYSNMYIKTALFEEAVRSLDEESRHTRTQARMHIYRHRSMHARATLTRSLSLSPVFTTAICSL